MPRSTLQALVLVALVATAYPLTASPEQLKVDTPKAMASPSGKAPSANASTERFAPTFENLAPALPDFLSSSGAGNPSVFCPEIPPDCCTLKWVRPCWFCISEDPSCP